MGNIELWREALLRDEEGRCEGEAEEHQLHDGPSPQLHEVRQGGLESVLPDHEGLLEQDPETKTQV